MADLCEEAVLQYLDALKKDFEIIGLEEGCLLITPFMRSDNEGIEIELTQQPDGRIRISDNSDTLDYLFVNGLSVHRSAWLRRRLNTIGARFSVQLERGEIFTFSEPNSLGQSIHAVLNAIQDASYLIYRREERGRPTFDEEVERFLIKNSVSYDERYSLQGKTRTHSFRFHANGTGHKLLEPLTATTSHAALVKAERLALWWMDIGERWLEYKKIAIVDDVGRRSQLWEGRPTDVLRGYSDHVILWTRHEDLLQVLRGG